MCLTTERKYFIALTFIYIFVFRDLPSMEHPGPHGPHQPSTCSPFPFTFVEHQALLAPAKVHLLCVFPPSLNGNTHGRFGFGGPLVLHTFP